MKDVGLKGVYEVDDCKEKQELWLRCYHRVDYVVVFIF